eukprot:Gb_08171 [translate_table: standard]
MGVGNKCAGNGNERSCGEELENQTQRSNAFQIIMLCMEEDFESRAIEFVSAVFKKVEKGYCFIKYPFSSPRIPVLQYFTQVPCKLSNCTPQVMSLERMALYVLHCRSLEPGFEVRPANSTDVVGVSEILEGFEDLGNIIDYIEQPRTECLTIVAVSSSQVVSFALVEESAPSEALFSHFDLNPFVSLEHQPPVEHATLILLTLNPIFFNRRRFFLREIMRQTNKTVIYCAVFPNQELPDVIKDLMLARPRQHCQMVAPHIWGQVSEPLLAHRSRLKTGFNDSLAQEDVHARQERSFSLPNYLQGNGGRNSVVQGQSQLVDSFSSLQINGYMKTRRKHSFQFNFSPTSLLGGRDLKISPRRGQFLGFDCALYYTTRKLICRQRAIVDSRILIVGASRTAESFLHKLITCPYMHFRNLTLVSSFGLKGLSSSMISCPDTRRGPASSFPKLGLDCEVKVISDHVVGLDRESRYVTLSTGQVLPYDYLVLSSGLQDQTRWLVGTGPQKGMLRLDELAMLLEDGNFGSNKIVGYGSPIVIYGATLEAFCAVQLLLSKGLKGENILMVYPESMSLEQLGISCFGDVDISELVLEEMKKKQVRVKVGMKLVGIFMNKTGEGLEELKFENVTEGSFVEKIQLPCSLLVTCDMKFMDIPLFRAIKKEGIVYDGLIIVDGTFRTNDPLIFATGSLCKFSRCCGKRLKLQTYSSQEVGKLLAESIISLFWDHLPDQNTLYWSSLSCLPEGPPQKNFEKEDKSLLPTFRTPKCFGGVLPGRLLFFSITCPQFFEVGVLQTLVTKGEEHIFKMDITRRHEVGRILYCGKETVEEWKMMEIVGLHECLLNKLLNRYMEGTIENLLKFLSQPWTMVIFHDKFREFYNDLCVRLLHETPEISDIRSIVIGEFLMYMELYKDDFQGLNIPVAIECNKSIMSMVRKNNQLAAKAPKTIITTETTVSSSSLLENM